MIDTDKIRQCVVTGLKNYLAVPVIRSNQNETPPQYPYLAYTITTLESENNGTYGEYEDGIDRNAVKQTWSISAVSADNSESVRLASKAKEWLERVGTVYLNDHDVICQKCTNITNRDNVLAVEYEYKNGFDAVFWDYSEVENPIDETGAIVNVNIGGNTLSPEDEYVRVKQGSEYAYKYLQVDIDGKVKPKDFDVSKAVKEYLEANPSETAVLTIKSWDMSDIEGVS